MSTVTIAGLRDHVDEEVVVRGWLHNKRSSGKLRFLIVRDGSGYAQAVVFKKAVSPEAWEAVDGAGQESTPGTEPGDATLAETLAEPDTLELPKD